MKWTKERPRMAGHYRYRGPLTEGREAILVVSSPEEGQRFDFPKVWLNGDFEPLSYARGEWQGPIAPQEGAGHE